MASTGLVFGNAKDKKNITSSDESVYVLVDAMVKESHIRKADTSQFPIENGSEISDQIITKPMELSIEGVITPMSLYDTFNAPSPTRVLDAFSNFERLIAAKLLVTIVTGLKVYENMLISDFQVDRTAQNGAALPFTMRLKEVRKVSTQTGQLPAAKITGTTATKLQVTPKVDVGKTVSGQSQTAAGGSSFLKPIEDSITRMFPGL